MLSYLQYPHKQPNRNDKLGCVAVANHFEPLFLTMFGKGTKTNLPIAINPEKTENNPYPIDFAHETVSFADLKFRQDPFYMGEELYGIHPQYLMTFNKYDAKSYAIKYGDVGIYFWTQWEPSDSLGNNLPIQRIKQVIRGMRTIHECSLSEVVSEGTGIDIQLVQQAIGERCLSNLIDSHPHKFHSYQDEQRIAMEGGNKSTSFVLDLRSFNCVDMEIDPECWPNNAIDFSTMLLDEIAMKRFPDGKSFPLPSNSPMREIALEAIQILIEKRLAREKKSSLLDGRSVLSWVANVTDEVLKQTRETQIKSGFYSRVVKTRTMEIGNSWRPTWAK